MEQMPVMQRATSFGGPCRTYATDPCRTTPGCTPDPIEAGRPEDHCGWQARQGNHALHNHWSDLLGGHEGCHEPSRDGGEPAPFWKRFLEPHTGDAAGQPSTTLTTNYMTTGGCDTPETPDGGSSFPSQPIWGGGAPPSNPGTLMTNYMTTGGCDTPETPDTGCTDGPLRSLAL